MTCERCGTTKPLLVHHRNGDHNDNVRTNLEVLCANCHYLVHGMGLDPDPIAKYLGDSFVWKVRVPEPVWDALVSSGRLHALVQSEIRKAQLGTGR